MQNIVIDYKLNGSEMRETFAAPRIDTTENYRRELADHWDTETENIEIIDINIEE